MTSPRGRGKVKSNKLLDPNILVCHQASFDQFINNLISLSFSFFVSSCRMKGREMRAGNCTVSVSGGLQSVIGID